MVLSNGQLMFCETFQIECFKILRRDRTALRAIANPALLVAMLLGNDSRSIKSSKKLYQDVIF